MPGPTPIIGQLCAPIVSRQLFIISVRHSATLLSERRQLAMCSCTVAIFSRISFDGAACEGTVDGAGSADQATLMLKRSPMLATAIRAIRGSVAVPMAILPYFSIPA
jgi:hypothetical protein